MANNNLLQIDCYIIDKSQFIGRGQYGTVYECKSKKPAEQNLNLCAKIIDVKDEKFAEREGKILNLIKNQYKFNPNIVQVYLVNYDKPGKQMIVVMEKCQTTLDSEQQNKFNRNQVYTNEMLKDFLKQLLIGYLPLYSNYIVHRDLKPENIMVNLGFSTIYKLVDFGVGKQKSDCSNIALISQVGSPAYAAPEISSYVDNDDTLNQDISMCQEFNSVDIYSIGIIMWQMMSGKLPYCKPGKIPSFSEKQEFFKILKTGVFPINQTYNVDPELLQLIKRMIVYYPSKRITFRELYQVFKIDVPNFEKQNSFSSASTNFSDNVAFKQQFPFSNLNFLKKHVFRTHEPKIPQFKNNQPKVRINTAQNQFPVSASTSKLNTTSSIYIIKLKGEILDYLKFLLDNKELMRPEKVQLINQCWNELSEPSLITLWALQISIKKIKPEFVYCSNQKYSSHQMRFYYFLELVFSNQIIDEKALQVQQFPMYQKLEEWSRAKQQQK